jgi:hypothetical protein
MVQTRICFIATAFQLFVRCTIRKVQEYQAGQQLNGVYDLLVYADDVALLRDNTDTIKKKLKLQLMLVRELF